MKNIINQRIYIIYFLIIISLLGLDIRLIYLQVFAAKELKEKAQLQQQYVVKLASKRGLITDRNGHELAVDVQSYSIFIEGANINISKPEIANKLSSVLKEDKHELLKKLNSIGNHWSWIKRKVDQNIAKKITDLKIKGIGVLPESKRVYPKNNLAASLIGFTGSENQGLSGIELSFDKFLMEGGNKITIIKDALGNEVLRKTSDNVPLLTSKVDANKVILTIDETIQYIVERELTKGIEEFQAERGLGIVMDILNGDILALATIPSFDPNKYEESNWKNIKNWAVTDFYEPGSTMKIFSIAAALETRNLKVDEVIECPGAIKVGKWIVHDHGNPPTRYLKPIEIIEVSSNVGVSKITRRIPPEQHRNLLERFGFGHSTQSGLSGEVSGILPPLPWDPVRQSTISFGQGIAVTPLQIVSAMSAIANNGIRVSPHVIQKIISPKGEVIREFKSTQTKVLSLYTANKMREMMIQVVQKGTGTGTHIPGYVIGGKTGTADKVVKGYYNGEVMSSFIGIVPADKPRLIIFVLLDSPKKAHFASITAVPIFKEISYNILLYLNIPPSKPEELLEKK